MYRRFVLAGLGTFALAATLALGVNASRWETAAALTNCTTTTAGLDGEETTVIQLINQERANAGLQALLVAPSLARAAAWKSADPSNTGSGGIPFSHTDSLGRGPSQRAADCGYPGQAAENIAYGYSASGVVVAWMNSAGHRANILSPYYTVIGAGHTGSSWVVDFGIVVEPGSYSLGGVQSATATPTTAATTANPTATSTSAPVGAAPATSTPSIASNQAAAPTATRTATPYGTPIPQNKLPTNYPIPRAMMQMVASE